MGSSLAGRVLVAVRDSTYRVAEAAAGLLPAAAAAATILLIFWGLATLARRVAVASARRVQNPARRELIRQVPYYIVWAVGAVVAFDVLGVKAETLVTGLGLGSVAVGFALKDILSNLVSGLLILTTHAFELNDQIIIGDTEGTVERIEFRATHIRTYDGRLVLVPNGEVFMSRVTNNTASPLRRASVFLPLDYSQDLERTLSTVLDAVKRVPGVAGEPAPSMRLGDLTSQYLQIEARFWTDSRRADFMNTASAVRVAIVAALLREGISLPHPGERRVTVVEAADSKGTQGEA